MQPPGPTPNKHQHRTAVTTEKLLKAAYAVFVRDGFEAARIADIAAKAGYTRGAFYAHFKNKYELFLALMEQRATGKAEQMRALGQSCATGEDRTWEALREFYISLASDQQWAVLLLEFKLHAVRKKQLRAKLADAHRRIRQQLHAGLATTGMQEGISAGRFTRPPVPDAVKAGLEALYTGLVLERAYDPKRISEGQTRELLGQVFDALLHVPGATASQI